MRISDWSSDVCSSRSSRQVRRTNLSQPFGDLRLEVGLRARADLRDDLARAHRTHRQAFVHRPAFGKARQEPRGEQVARAGRIDHPRSEEHTSELQSLMRTSYAVFCLKKKTPTQSNI